MNNHMLEILSMVKNKEREFIILIHKKDFKDNLKMENLKEKESSIKKIK
jgi:hypothetical protein